MLRAHRPLTPGLCRAYHVRALLCLASTSALLASCDMPPAPAGGSASAEGAKSAAPAAAGAEAKATTKEVDLAPLPLKITLPADEAALTMDKTMGDKKSVGVSYDALFAGLNVSEPVDESFEEVRKSIEGDTVMFPFKKYVEESKTSVIAEVTSDDKTVYTAWAWKEIGGKPYLCQSAGMSGLKSVEDAKKALAACDTLAAK